MNLPDDPDSFVIIDPDDREGSEPTSPTPGHGDLLTELMRRSVAALATAPAAQDYLRSAGVTDPTVWAAVRLGAGDASLTGDLSTEDWTTLDGLGLVHRLHRTLVLAKPGGLNLPTFDPREPERVLSVIRLTPAQNLHRFVTPPRGVAGACDLITTERVVLVDTPLVGLRLIQLGVAGVAIVEDAAVLAPLAPWLSGRQLVIATHRDRQAARLRQVLALVGLEAVTATLMPDVARLSAESLALLGLDRAAVRPEAPREPITPQLLHRLAEFARGRLALGEGGAALAALELDAPDVASVYGMGYLPPSSREALPSDARRALAGLRLGGSIFVPAFDEQGAVVDALVAQAHDGGHVGGVLPEPRGLLAPNVARAYKHLVVVDHVRALGRAYRRGGRNVLLLRGASDAALNAARLRASGVRSAELRVRREAEAIAAALTAEGIAVRGAAAGTVTPLAALPAAKGDAPAPAPIARPAGLELIEHDEVQHRAAFRADELTIAVEVPWQGTTILDVIVRRQGERHQERFDLAVEAKRQRFAAGAARRLGVPAECIAALLAEVLARMTALAEADESVPAAPAPLPSSDTTALAAASDLVSRYLADLDAAGWIGDEQAKLLALLTLAGRTLDDPPWLVLRGEHVLTAPALMVVAALVTEPNRLTIPRGAEGSIVHLGRDALRRRVFLVDEPERLKPETVTALRLLQERHALAVSEAVRDGATGRLRARTAETRGPLTVVAASATACPLDELAVIAPLDDSPQQTARVLLAARQRRSAAEVGGVADRLARWRDLLAALPRVRVHVPFAARVTFPARHPRHRREQERFFALAEAAALLHHAQRERAGETIVATEADFTLAERAARGLLGASDEGLSERARALLLAVRAAGHGTVTMPQLAQLLPQWGRGVLRAVLDELVRLDLIASPAGGRGRRARPYRLLPEALAEQRQQPVVRLLPVGEREVQWSDGIGGNWFSSATNLSGVGS